MVMHRSRTTVWMDTNIIRWIVDVSHRAQRHTRNTLSGKCFCTLYALLMHSALSIREYLPINEIWQFFYFSAQPKMGIHFRSYGTLPTPVKSSTPVYSNNPGKIENFTPGHSSVSDKERKEVNTGGSALLCSFVFFCVCFFFLQSRVCFLWKFAFWAHKKIKRSECIYGLSKAQQQQFNTLAKSTGTFGTYILHSKSNAICCLNDNDYYSRYIFLLQNKPSKKDGKAQKSTRIKRHHRELLWMLFFFICYQSAGQHSIKMPRDTITPLLSLLCSVVWIFFYSIMLSGCEAVRVELRTVRTYCKRSVGGNWVLRWLWPEGSNGDSHLIGKICDYNHFSVQCISAVEIHSCECEAVRHARHVCNQIAGALRNQTCIAILISRHNCIPRGFWHILWHRISMQMHILLN